MLNLIQSIMSIDTFFKLAPIGYSDFWGQSVGRWLNKYST